MHDNNQHISSGAIGGKNIAIVGGGPGGLTLERQCSKTVLRWWSFNEIKTAAHASKAAH